MYTLHTYIHVHIRMHVLARTHAVRQAVRLHTIPRRPERRRRCRAEPLRTSGGRGDILGGCSRVQIECSRGQASRTDRHTDQRRAQDATSRSVPRRTVSMSDRTRACHLAYTHTHAHACMYRYTHTYVHRQSGGQIQARGGLPRQYLQAQLRPPHARHRHRAPRSPQWP